MFTKAASCLALLSIATASWGAVPGEVIVAYEISTATFAVMSPDGSNFGFVDCGGDLSYGGAPRYFVSNISGSNVLPAWYYGNSVPQMNTELVASDEDCAQSVILTNEGNKYFSGMSWSPDGSMIAAYAEEFDLNSGVLIGRGIYLADVLYTGSRPTGTANVRLAIPLGGNRAFDWAADSRGIGYADAGIDGSDLFLYDLDTNSSSNITNSPGRSEFDPTFSPTGRIAYVRKVASSRGGDRYDIFSIPATGGPEFQITSKSTTGASVNMGPCYSPDGQQLSFVSGTLTGDRALYRIMADGSAKAVKIASRSRMSFGYNVWRR